MEGYGQGRLFYRHFVICIIICDTKERVVRKSGRREIDDRDDEELKDLIMCNGFLYYMYNYDWLPATALFAQQSKGSSIISIIASASSFPNVNLTILYICMLYDRK